MAPVNCKMPLPPGHFGRRRPLTPRVKKRAIYWLERRLSVTEEAGSPPYTKAEDCIWSLGGSLGRALGPPCPVPEVKEKQ